MAEETRRDAFHLEEAFQALSATPGVVRALLEEAPLAWLHYQEDPEAWSPYQVLVHLIHNDRENWLPRARIILTEGPTREFPAFERLPEDGDLLGRPVAELLATFERERREALAELRAAGLQAEDLEREGLHPALGRVQLRQLLATWVVHDFNHIHQMVKTMAKRYREAVGPWRQFLPVLDL